MPVTIDPRRHDAVLFGLDESAAHTGPAATLLRQLRSAGVRTAAVPPTPNPAALIEAAGRMAVRPGRSVVVADTPAAVGAGRDGGFGLVIGLDRGQSGARTQLRGRGADVVLTDLGEVTVRTGDRPMSALPDASAALDVLAENPAARIAVFFDFDGTLSDIVDDPDSAQLAPGAAEGLRALSSCCPVAVLSGRDLADVRERVGLPGIWYAGSHGFELTGPDGAHHQNDAATAALPVLSESAASLSAELGAIPGVIVEHKRFGVSVHYRNAARDRVGQAIAAVHGCAQRHRLRVTTGREVVELRPDVDWDKGKTLRWVMDQLVGHGSTDGPMLPVYLGDDITDEDGFDEVARPDLAGIGIIVRHTEDGDRPTAARYALDSPARVGEFTAELARRIGARPVR
ncbi:MAG TPA: trehalose-phosphatase [Mycobacterium sp.]